MEENGIQLADDGLEHVDLLMQQVHDVLFHRTFGDQVVDVHIPGLPQARCV